MTSPHLRRRRLRLLALAVTPAVGAALLVTTAPVSAAGREADPVPVRAAEAQRAAESHTVTLITGDVVHVRDHGDGTSSVEVTRAPGARGGVRAETIGGHLYVVPDEALPYLASRRVDRRLFDVTGLVEQGYDDEHSGRIPLIISYSSAVAAASASLPATTTVRSLRSVSGAAVRTTKSRTRSLWKALTPARTRKATPSLRTVSPDAAVPQRGAAPLLGEDVAYLSLDGRNHLLLAQSTAQIGTAAAWARGLEGDGVRVAVLDTGYDQQHPDLATRVSESASFVPGETVQDGNGHGTHTASTVGGSGAASGGLEKGVAPASDLIVGKVLSDAGSGDDSWVIAGMEWAAAKGASSETHALVGGRRTTNDFFGPVVHPSNGGGFWNSTRYSGFVSFNVQPWSDGGRGRAGYMQFADTKRLLVYADGEQVADSEWASASLYPVPDGDVHYKLDLTTGRDPKVYELSPRTHTVWDVRSPAITDGLDTMDTMSLLQVSYDVTTDLAGRVARGRQQVGIAVTHLPGAAGAGRIARPKVLVSFDDGAHWRAVEVTSRGAGSARASFVAPKRGYVSLRVTAQDDAGNAVTQDVIRAYGVR